MKSSLNSPIRLVAMCILSYFILLTCLGVSISFGGTKEALGVMLNLLDVLPFGNTIGGLVYSIAGNLLSVEIEQFEAITKLSIPSFFELIEDFLKLMLTGACYEAIKYFLENVTGIYDEKGFWIFFQKLVVDMIAALLSCLLANIVLGFVFGVIADTGKIFATVLTTLTTLGTIVAGFFLIKASLQTGLGIVFFIFITKYIFINSLKVLFIYIFVMLMILVIYSGKLILIAPSFGVLVISFVGLYLMEKSIMGFAD